MAREMLSITLEVEYPAVGRLEVESAAVNSPELKYLTEDQYNRDLGKCIVQFGDSQQKSLHLLLDGI